MITVRLPAMLGGETLTLTTDIRNIRELTTALHQSRPEIASRLNDTIFNFAVNDEMLLHDVDNHHLRDGDVVEIVPAISGG